MTYYTRSAVAIGGGVRAPRPTEGYKKYGEAGRQGRPPLRRGCMSCGGRADVGIGPYGELQEVRRSGQTWGRPPLRNDKRRGWSWHAVYAYIRIYTIYTRKSLAEFAARRRQKNSNHFSPRHVRGEKYLSGCQCGILSLATKLCAQQTANPFGRKFRRNFLPVKKRRPKASLFCRM